jgi:hypothetical protein
MPSGEMKRLGYGWIRKIPAQSLTGRLLAGQKLSRPGELVDAAVWFPGRTGPLWEEVRILGGTGRILTFLVFNETQASESS